MNGKRKFACALWVCLAVLGTSPLFAAEQGGGDQGGGQQGGGRGGPGRGGPGGFMMGRGGGTGWIDGMLQRSIGIEQTAKVEDLPFGEAKRLVQNVPVGGVDNLREGRDGWKVEEIFTLTPEQGEALNALREEYKNELAKLQTEYDEAQKAIAEKVKALRLAYETKANDVLTDPAKPEKIKLDALAKEYAAKNQEQMKERTAQFTEARINLEKSLVEARQNNNWEKMREAFGKVHEMSHQATEQRTTLAKDVQEKMKGAVTGGTQEKLTELLKQQENRGGWGGRGPDRGGDRGGNRGGQPGGGQPGGGGAEKPPAPPGEF